MKKRKIIVIILIILVIIIAGGLGIYVGSRNTENLSIAEGIVINKENDQDYNVKFITNSEEYNDLINKFNLKNKLNINDLDTNDYIIDFLPYENDLIIKDIKLEIDSNKISLTYYLNKKINSNEQYLVYMIPIKKGTIKTFNIEDRKFVYDN